MPGNPIAAVILVVVGIGLIGLSIIAPTNDISVTVHTYPPLSVLVDYNPYAGTVTVRGTNQDARPLEFIIGAALLIGGIILLKPIVSD